LTRPLLLGFFVCTLAACTPRSYTFTDGGLDASGPDGVASDVPAPLALDLSVTGCARYDVSVPRCAGPPPLVLSFAPVGSPTLTRFVWTFGDGTPSSTERAPTHTYALPGVYDVSVVAEGAMGSISRPAPKLVEVTALPAGAACDVSAQCAAGLSCRCAGGACGDGFARGLCTRACDGATCGAGAACAALALPPTTTLATDAGVSDAVGDASADAGDARADAGDASPDAGDASTSADAAAPAAGACLATCVADADCSAGLRCRAAPAVGGAARWVRSCVPPAFGDVGAPCRDENGALDDGACATGQCTDLGALGACGATCGAAGACPAGAACATFGNGRALCLAPCGAGATCARDPLLRCEAAGAAGALGFQISPAPAAGTTFCAPRTCASSNDCGPSGTCTPLGAGAHCASVR
jgi:hypothetical protein